MISYVTGTLGAGKSMYAAKKIGMALLHGRVVATNMHLVDGWSEIVARRVPGHRISTRAKRAARCASFERRYEYVPELWRLMGARVRGRGENRGLMVIDEAHNELNNREWAEENQKEALKKLTLARKRGWEVLIISQHKDNTDAAARRIATVEIRCLNWKQLTRVPLIGTPLLPMNLFLAMGFPTNQPANLVSAKKVLFRELYRVGWYAKLYDTFEDFDYSADEDALWLPHLVPSSEIPSSGPEPGASALGGPVVSETSRGEVL